MSNELLNSVRRFFFSARECILILLIAALGIWPAWASSPPPDQANDQGKTADALLESGRSLARQGLLAHAEIQLQEATLLAPDKPEALRAYAKVEARLGRLDHAISLFKRAVSLQPNDADVHLELALALADAQRLPEALDQVSIAERIAPNSALIHLNRARLLDDSHRRTEAAREFSVAHRLAPDNADCLYYWSLLERSQGQLAEETKLLQQLVRLHPTDGRALFQLGRSLAEQQRDQEAIPILRQAIANDPASKESLYLLARLLRRSAPEESSALMRRFQELRVQDAALDSVKTVGNEAVQASDQNNWPRAIELFRKALAACHGCSAEAGLHKDLGLALCHNGELDAGALELHLALRLNPNDPDILKALQIINK